MRRLILFASVALFASSAAQAADWRVVAIDDAGEPGQTVGASVAFVDLETIARQGDTVRFAMEVRFRPQRGSANIMRSRMRAECTPRRWASEGSAIYADDRLLDESGPSPMADARPGTNAVNVIDGVCNRQFQSGSVDPASHAEGILAQTSGAK
ncbi:MAG: hypothetical protein ACT4N8_04915 [Sphingosinicella sp.]|uniref:hypothetical protein n=1 Tax=Sphingosinicella sp. TaxID=1917971 RepID=UPI004037E0FE